MSQLLLALRAVTLALPVMIVPLAHLLLPLVAALLQVNLRHVLHLRIHIFSLITHPRIIVSNAKDTLDDTGLTAYM